MPSLDRKFFILKVGSWRRCSLKNLAETVLWSFSLDTEFLLRERQIIERLVE